MGINTIVNTMSHWVDLPEFTKTISNGHSGCLQLGADRILSSFLILRCSLIRKSMEWSQFFISYKFIQRIHSVRYIICQWVCFCSQKQKKKDKHRDITSSFTCPSRVEQAEMRIVCPALSTVPSMGVTDHFHPPNNQRFSSLPSSQNIYK